ncbi:MAG: alpha-glucan family phosphorylase [Thermodesulfobacteriota bacterium]|nr:alpha-glucan family phosphorylase [Thermodesulfobacteriota bacterium]
MKDIVVYTVMPNLPERLRPLMDLAKNLWFSWNLEGIDIFRSIDQNLWEETNHNPLAVLGRLGNERIQELLGDEGFLSEMDRIFTEFKRYTEKGKAYHFGLETPFDFTVAYLSAEYGLTDCLPIYSGGLGVLAGDHLKSASDLRVPIVGVGLFYQKGYFRQYLNVDGWQQETYPDNDFHVLPATIERDEKGDPLSVEVPIKNRKVKVRVWRIAVGRIPLFMLDTNTVENSEEDRDITSALYAGDREMRLKQEIVLGIGGVRALDKMGYRPAVFHMNEGHSALAILERIRLLMERHQLSFAEAREAVYASNIFTTHTPIPAGIDIFDRPLMESCLGNYVRALGISMETFLSLGAEGSNPNEPFNMAVMALKNSAKTNGVSELHKNVSRRMWRRIWPMLPEVDIPIEGVTNGIHIPSYISDDMSRLFNRYLGRKWAEDPDNVKVWERVNRIPDSELWRAHERRRERLVAFTRQRLQEQLLRRGGHKIDIQAAGEVLNQEALTIGFARRFAVYKRGDLILKDPARLAKILNDPQKPVQIIFAGKAHPQDNEGKMVIKNIIHLAQQPEFRHKIAFIEDYDLTVARYMVQGADVWLNNPLRPLEACGTSGMKAAANGALNMSVLDGWWAEGYQPGLGWAIGSGEDYEDHEYQNLVESQAIYDLLERHVVHLFYDRGRDNMPRKWIGGMKKSMSTLAARFNAHRMLEDYLHQFYLPLALNWREIEAGNFEKIRTYSSWANHLRGNWSQIKILEKRADVRSVIPLGETLKVEARLQLGRTPPQDISVGIYYGLIDSKAEFIERDVIILRDFTQEGDQTVFRGEIPSRKVGRFGFRVRILPSHPLLTNPYSLGLILWG